MTMNTVEGYICVEGGVVGECVRGGGVGGVSVGWGECGKG